MCTLVSLHPSRSVATPIHYYCTSTELRLIILMIHQFLARTRNSIPVSEFSDYVLEMTQEDERSISHLVREFSVKFCLLVILS